MTRITGHHILAGILTWSIMLKICVGQEDEKNSTADYDYAKETNVSFDYSGFEVMCSKEGYRQFQQWFIPTFYAIICFVGLVGNLLVILTYFYFNRLKTMTDVYLLNLSFADLFFVLSLPFWAFNSMREWVLGLAVCKIIYSVYKVTFYSSMFLLSSISVDRYFAISKAVSAHKHRSQAVFFSKISSAVMWVLAFIFSIPEMKFTTINNNTCTPYASTNDKLRVSLQASQIVLTFLLPLIVMSFCYISIIWTLSRTRGFERNKAIKVILAVVAVFLSCQMPYNIVLFWTTLVTAKGGSTVCDDDNTLYYAKYITQSLAFFRCCLNPIVYAFLGVKFRNDVLKLLKHFGCLSQERFFRYAFSKRKGSLATDTETSTTFSP
ncbi:unnamed protein product [Knipowitschia caucasica]